MVYDKTVLVYDDIDTVIPYFYVKQQTFVNSGRQKIVSQHMYQRKS